MTTFEIGIVYKKESRLYIAVNSSTLVNAKNCLVTEVRPHTKYKVVRSISVENLCDFFDGHEPPNVVVKPSPA